MWGSVSVLHLKSSLSWPSTTSSIQISSFPSCQERFKHPKPSIGWLLRFLFLLKFSDCISVNVPYSKLHYSLCFPHNASSLRQTERRLFKPSIDTDIVQNALKFTFIFSAAYKLLSHGIWFELQKQSIPFPHWSSALPQGHRILLFDVHILILIRLHVLSVVSGVYIRHNSQTTGS